jgi:hypothetical protein
LAGAANIGCRAQNRQWGEPGERDIRAAIFGRVTVIGLNAIGRSSAAVAGAGCRPPDDDLFEGRREPLPRCVIDRDVHVADGVTR